MSKLKKFRPYVRNLPEKTLKLKKAIWSDYFYEGDVIKLPSDYLEGGAFYLSRVSSDDYSASVGIDYLVETEILNLNYVRELEEYNSQLGDLEKWEAEQAEIEKVEREKAESEEYAKYLELKGKYDDKGAQKQ